ncbi:MAG TPA: short-chain dehydrogenase [Methylophilaceae bacterium]|nr:short-chain dehydrogenase [Methylophilaceae bacterium]
MSVKTNKPVCVIVGVGPGNGTAFARRFSKEGYQLALLARRSELIADLAIEIRGSAYACDVADVASIAQTFTAIRAEMGEVDTLIFNLGAGVWKSVEEITAEEFEQSWRVNALGALLVSQLIIPNMKANKHGNIIFIGATASRRGGAKTAAFAPAKAAQRSLAESMARHLGIFGIHVATVVVDAVVDTPATRKMMPSKPDEFFLRPDDLAETVFNLTQQKPSAWSSEIEVRPFGEVW